jgi:hypothetical protein
MIATSDAPAAEAPVATPAAPADAPVEQPSAEQTAPAEPTIRKIDGPEAEALDLLSISRGAIVKRALPVVVVVAAIVIWFIAK